MSSEAPYYRAPGLAGFGGGLFDWSSDCKAQIAGYSQRYVFAGSRVRWSGVGYPHGGAFSDRIAAIRNALGGAFTDVNVTSQSGAVSLQKSFTIEATSALDRGDIGDIASDFEATLATLGWTGVQGSIGFVSKPSPDQICGPGGGLGPGPTPGNPAAPPPGSNLLDQIVSQFPGGAVGLAAGAIIVFFVMRGR